MKKKILWVMSEGPSYQEEAYEQVIFRTKKGALSQIKKDGFIKDQRDANFFMDSELIRWRRIEKFEFRDE